MQQINVRNLFIVACVLKVASALAGWHFNAPWTLGFALPLVVMVGYMWLGATRRNDEVSDEKFADSCYYLGFIFTIASISVALMDLPNIGTHIQDIAVRFGAAMLSTVLGLSVRVAMVTFRKDLGDAIYNAEEGVVEASIRFRDQLGVSLDRMSSFDSAVEQAARLSVERVNLQVESLSKNHADRLAEFFTELTAGNQTAFNEALAEVKGASTRLAESVDGYALGMRSNLASIEAKVGVFSDAVTKRLQTTTFPDDYFVRHLEEPLGKLKSAAEGMHSRVSLVSEKVGESAEVLSLALGKLHDRASTTETALESISNLAMQQQHLLNGSHGMMDKLQGLGSTLQSLDSVMSRTVETIERAQGSDAELKDAVRSVVADSEALRATVRDQLAEVARQLISASEGQHQNFGQTNTAFESAAQSYSALAVRLQTATEDTASKLLEGASANLQVADRLAASAAAAQLAAGKLESAAENDAKTAGALSVLGERATAGFQRVDAVVEQLTSIALHLSKVDASLGSAVNSREPGPAQPTSQNLAVISTSPQLTPHEAMAAVSPSVQATLDVSRENGLSQNDLSTRQPHVSA